MVAEEEAMGEPGRTAKWWHLRRKVQRVTEKKQEGEVNDNEKGNRMHMRTGGKQERERGRGEAEASGKWQ